MRLDIMNPASLMPAQPSESGAPVMVQNPVPFQSVTPTRNLPDEGSRPDDKDPKNKNEYQNIEEDERVEHRQLPESFMLIMAPDFRDLFLSYLKEETFPLVQARREQRSQNGVGYLKPFSEPYAKMTKNFTQREENHQEVLMYHYRRPGNRFKGKM